VLIKLTILFDRTIGRRFYRIHRFVYQRTGGLIGRRSPAGSMLLLTTSGRKTGRARTTPLLYMSDGARFLVVGSNGGRDQAPSWILNVAATPTVKVQVGRRRFEADAHLLTTEEKTTIWPQMVGHYKGWAHYQLLTDRELRVVSLTPRTGP